MKKLTLIFICVLVVATLCLPNVVSAETKLANDVHFIAPTGIAIVGNYLLVSDNVADNQSAILCFDVADGHAHKFTHLLDKQAVGLTSSDDRLFVIFADSFVEYSIADGGSPLDSTSPLKIEETYNVAKVIDVCVGKYKYDTGVTQERIYLLQNSTTGDSLMYIKPDGTAGSTNMIPVANGYDILFLNDGTDDYVYIAGENANGENSLTRFGCYESFNIYTDKLNANPVTYTSGYRFELLGLTTNNLLHPVVYGSKVMYNVDNDSDGFKATTTFANFDTSQRDIIKVASSKDHLAILNDNNQIEIYQHVAGTVPKLSETFSTIGSDQVNVDAPTTYTGFTLAKSSGYPTNIIYKTNNEKTSLPNILTKEQVGEFVILDYEGAEQSSYYYVFVNGKFGWIKKSDNATTPQTDDKIEIIDTKLSDKVNYNTEFKFNSLGQVFLYDLPSSDSTICNKKTLTQTASTMISVKVLQQFVEESTGIIWYYVEYEEEQRGFVKSTDVASFTATLIGPVQFVGDKQVNASLFNAVTLHTTKALDEKTAMTYDGTELIKLYSGDKVKVIEVDQEAGASFVQVVGTDGNHTYGWVESARLIDVDAITTNAIVGFSALSVAIVLAVVLFSVFISRKRKVKQ